MSGDVPGAAAAYEPGGGYQAPRGGLTPRIFWDVPLGALLLVLIWLRDDSAGTEASKAMWTLGFCTPALAICLLAILRPAGRNSNATERDRQAKRLFGVAGLILYTAIATLSVRTLFFPE